MCDQQLDPNAILSREFEYAAQTAFQAHEDRVRVLNYYLASAGTLVAAIALGDFGNPTHMAIFGLLLGALAILGFVSVIKLAKLRLSWVDSVRAMCQIKAHYVRASATTDLADAFRWTTETIPLVGKKWSIAFLIALTTALLSSAAAAGAVALWGLAVSNALWIGQSVLVAGFWLVGQVAFWILVCRD